MKKLISLFLALTMVLGMATTAFAAETTDTNKATANEESSNKADIEVTGKYLSQLNSDEIISVDVAWEDMHFIYYATQQGTWKPETHTYDGDKTAKWNKTTSDITVTNHSNVEITADLSYTASVSTVTGTLSATTIELANAAEGDSLGNTTKAPSGTSTFTIGGSMDSTSSTDLGTITVALKEGSNAGDSEDKGDTDDDIEWTEVSTFEALESALETGGNVRMMNDITGEVAISTKKSFALDLGGNTLTLRCIELYDNSVVASISSGTIIGTNSCAVRVRYGSKLEISNCTLTGNNYWALYLCQGSTTLKNTTLNGGVLVEDGAILTATENVTATYAENQNVSGICVGSGSSATFGFDPSDLISKSYNKGTVKDNGDGTWTVS